MWKNYTLKLECSSIWIFFSEGEKVIWTSGKVLMCYLIINLIMNKNYTIISPDTHTHTHKYLTKMKWHQMGHTSYQTQWSGTTVLFNQMKGCRVEPADESCLCWGCEEMSIVVTPVQYCTGCSNMAKYVRKVTTLRLWGENKSCWQMS